MKSILAILFALPIYCCAQNFDTYCTVPKFEHIYIFAQPNGAGIEFGTWPQEDNFGFIVGNTVTYQKGSDVNKTTTSVKSDPYIIDDVHFKTVFRLNRFFYLVGTTGFAAVMSGYKTGDRLVTPYVAGGLRISMPFGEGKNWSFVVEPQYGTRGPNILAGMAFAIK